MNLMSRTITGIVMIIVGLALIAFSFFSSFVFLFYGIPISIIGFFILLNKKEDKIERIKRR
jgi:uncharacterized membrane protein HdeD (DUF308 family)